MKKHLHYLWAAMFAAAALPAAAQTEESPQVVILGENTVETEATYFKFTTPENALVRIEGIAVASYDAGAIKTTDAEGNTEPVGYVYNASTWRGDSLWMEFYAEVGKTYTFSYSIGWSDTLPLTFECTATPVTEGSLNGATCADPIVIPQDGQALFPFLYQETPTTVYAKYIAEADGRLIVHTSDNVRVLYAGFNCDDIDVAMVGDYNSQTELVDYDGNFVVEKGDVVYFKTMGTSAVIVTCEVEDMTPGATCKDAFEGKVGENVIPAAAGTYWYTFKNTDDATRYFIFSSDATNLNATFASSCTSDGIRKDNLNYKETVTALNSRVLQIEKHEATDSDETFKFEIVPLDPVDDADVGQSITAGEQVTTPSETAYYYYTLTAPEGEPMLMVISSDANEADYNGYNPAIRVSEFGSYSSLNDFKDNPCNFKLKSTPGMKYMFRVDVKNETPITFSVSFEELQPGCLKSAPIEAQLGSNEIPAFTPVYYSFQDPDGLKLQLVPDVEGATMTVQTVNRSWGDPYYTDATINENDEGYWVKVEPGVEYLFTLVTPDGTKGNLELTQLPFGVGEAWQTAKEVEAGTYDLPTAPMEYWFKLISPQDGFISVSSNMYATNWSNNISIYLNGVNDKPLSAATDYETNPAIYKELKVGVAKDQVVYVKFLSYEPQEDITATLAFMDAEPGQTSSTAIPLEYKEGGLTYDFPGNLGMDSNWNYVYEWYSIDLPEGVFSVISKDMINFNLYSADNTLLPLVSGGWFADNQYGIRAYNIDKAGTYYLTAYNTSNYDGRETVSATILVRDPLPGETVATAIEVSEAGQQVDVPKSDGDDFYIKINVCPGNLTFLTEPGQYMYGNLYKEDDLTNEVAEVLTKYDEETGEMVCGLVDFEVENTGAYILRIYNSQTGATVTFSGSALGGEVVEPVFPEEFDITASAPGIEIDQMFDDDIEALTINVGGVSDTEEFTLSFNLPEGWDGVILAKASMGGLSMNEWPTIGEFEEEMEEVELLKGTDFTFTAPTRMQIFSGYLYTDGKVDVEHGFMLGMMVDYEKTDVAVNVEVVDGAAFNYTLPMNTASSFSLNLPADWEVKSAVLNGEEIEVAPKYTVEAGEEDLDYVFEVEYTGEFVTVDSTTGMVALDTTVIIGIVDGKIRIENTTVGDAIAVYSIGGMVVGQYNAQDTAVEISVPAGTYIVTVNKNAAKVLVP